MSTATSNFKLLFLGTGASTAVPELGHVIRRSCPQCINAHNDLTSKNRRNNVAIALIFEADDGSKKCAMIDAGKTMRDSCIRHFYNNQIEQVDAVIITHGHAGKQHSSYLSILHTYTLIYTQLYRCNARSR